MHNPRVLFQVWLSQPAFAELSRLAADAGLSRGNFLRQKVLGAHVQLPGRPAEARAAFAASASGDQLPEISRFKVLRELPVVKARRGRQQELSDSQEVMEYRVLRRFLLKRGLVGGIDAGDKVAGETAPTIGYTYTATELLKAAKRVRPLPSTKMPAQRRKPRK